MGFNAVWMNPINESSDISVRRYNFLTFEDEDVKGSLYATKDFSRLNYELFPDLSTGTNVKSTGDPHCSTSIERDYVFNYTETARANGLIPIFDLVLNHVAKDSPLITGEFSHFQELNIDTSRWFKSDPDGKWDDIIPFDYSDPNIRREIIDYLWVPYLEKYIDQFGFMGVRVDFATGISTELQRELFPQLRNMVQDKFDCQPIIFAECLPPKGLEHIVEQYRELYTHATNCSLFTLDKSNHDIGLKQQLTHLSLSGEVFENVSGGTIGFSSSHDDGPNARNALEHIVHRRINEDDYLRYLYHQKHSNKKELERFFNRVTTEVLENIVDLLENGDDLGFEEESTYKQAIQDMEHWVVEQRRRIATCALISDGGHYLLIGDEFSDATPRSVFTCQDSQVYNEADNFIECRKNLVVDHSNFITNLNQALKLMSASEFQHWTKFINIQDELVVSISFNTEGFNGSTELCIVNLSDNKVVIDNELLEQIARQFQKSENDQPSAYDAIMRSRVFLINNLDSEELEQDTVLCCATSAQDNIFRNFSESWHDTLERIQAKEDADNQQATEKRILISQTQNRY